MGGGMGFQQCCKVDTWVMFGAATQVSDCLLFSILMLQLAFHFDTLVLLGEATQVSFLASYSAFRFKHHYF